MEVSTLFIKHIVPFKILVFDVSIKLLLIALLYNRIPIVTGRNVDTRKCFKWLHQIEHANKLKIEKNNDDIIRSIASELGVLPDIEISNPSKVKLAICVEGKNDITFLKEVNECNPELKKIVDLSKSEEIILLPMGGSTLQFWVNNDYLGRLSLNQLHIYDSDIGSDEPHKYKKYVEIINKKGHGNLAYETILRAFENYFSPELITELYGVSVDKAIKWNEADIPEIIAKHNHDKSESPRLWADLDEEDIKEKKRKIKNQLNETHSKKLTLSNIDKIGAKAEIENWFNDIAKLIKTWNSPK